MQQLSLFPYHGTPAHLCEPRKAGWTRDSRDDRFAYCHNGGAARVVLSERQTWGIYLKGTSWPMEGPSGRRLCFRTAAAAIAAAEKAIAEGR